MCYVHFHVITYISDPHYYICSIAHTNLKPNSLYLNAIFTAIEGVVAIMISGIADFSNLKKLILIGAILFYGACALPFAGLTAKTYPVLNAMAAMYGLLNITSPIYEIMEGSYIPIFMRSRAAPVGAVAEEVRRKQVLEKGTTVSVLGIFIGNVGGITALLIGIVISYTRGTAVKDGYHK